jgi:hypothetical protein
VKLAAASNLAPVPEGYKRCTDPKCRRVYEATEENFTKNIRNTDGLATKCRICATVDQHKYRSLKWITEMVGSDNIPPEEVIRQEEETEKHEGMVRLGMPDGTSRWMTMEAYAEYVGLNEIQKPPQGPLEGGLANNDN